VDDDQTTNFVNQLLLEDLEISGQVLVSVNGREAIDLIRQQCMKGDCPQLILLDINMPVMNGFEFLEAYKDIQFACKQSVVIVMLTTSMNPLDVERLREMPVNDLLNKPLTEDKVKELFRQHFHQGLAC
jgi:CheY-like chemotaxis protein